MNQASFFQLARKRVDKALERWLPAKTINPSRLHEAMRYAAFNGGKRVRPVLVYATGSALGVAHETLDGPACAVELIHAYSLVHDDLPAMDNDVLRRGKPTCHIQFDEATAILAGDAMQALAFHIIAYDELLTVNAESRLEMIDTLAIASGSRGMAGGQAIDLMSVGKTLNVAELENMHIHKTGALIRACVKLGALTCPGVSIDTLEKLDHYAKCIGLAFQIRDDILDVEGDTDTLGKTQGADIALNKPTYPAIVGLAESKAMAKELCDQALGFLSGFDDKANHLRALAQYIIDREH